MWTFLIQLYYYLSVDQQENIGKQPIYILLAVKAAK